MKRTLFTIVILSVMSVAALLNAAISGSDVILGKWWNEEKTAQIEIYKDGGTYSGKIVWLNDPLYPADDPKGMAGKPKVDRENADPAKQNRPVLGMMMVWGFLPAGENHWDKGFIYDPKNGKTYKCKMTLKPDDVLDVRGFIGVSLLGRTTTWTRVK